MKRFVTILMILLLCAVFSGCSNLFDGYHISVQPHKEQNSQTQNEGISAASYNQLYRAIRDLGEAGTENAYINVAQYNQDNLEADIQRAIHELMQQNPIWAYAVESANYEIGARGGQNAVALSISYLHDKAEIGKIKHAEDVAGCKELVGAELNACSAGVVILVEQYAQMDYQQLVQDYADLYPNYVMEVPQVKVNVYPEKGISRVVEVKFTYQNSRELLRNMQNVVQPVFNAARLFVIQDADTGLKYSQLYSFLMERFDYKIEASLTPAYSLLRYGVGDQKAFAVVYAAMCRQTQLECLVITGTRDGKSCFWNMINVDGTYYHVDLLRASQEGDLRFYTDEEMTGYVWDYTAYPQHGVALEEPSPENP